MQSDQQNCVTLGIRLGENSAHGSVFKGTFNGNEVAIKIFGYCYNKTVIKDIENKTKIMEQLNHQNLVRFIDVSRINDYFCLVMELAEGSLFDYLYKKDIKFIDEYTKKGIANHIATGLMYLHSKNIIHRDIKSQNILLSKGIAKIGDYGIAHSMNISIRCIAASSNSMAPEVINCLSYDSKVDIYSFGTIMFELCIGKMPWENFKLIEIGVKVVSGERPEIALETPKEWRKLITECWSQDPIKRPTADQLIQIIDGLPG